MVRVDSNPQIPVQIKKKPAIHLLIKEENRRPALLAI